MELIKKTFFKYHYQQELVVEAQALRNALEQKNGLPIAITQPVMEKIDPVDELF